MTNVPNLKSDPLGTVSVPVGVVNVDISAWKRLEEIRHRKNETRLVFRFGVDGGGCSGFKYLFDIDGVKEDDDLVLFSPLPGSDCVVVVDEMSLPFLEGATLAFVQEIVGSRFEVINPNASSGCGCGVSFAV